MSVGVEATEGLDGRERSRSIDLHVGWTLFGSLVLSLSVMVVGVALGAVHGRNVATTIIPLDRLFHQISERNPAAVIDAGILMLFAAPILGVLVACVDFVRQRDSRFALVTGALLVILIGSFAVALH